MDDLKCIHLLDQFLTFYDKAAIANANPTDKYKLWKDYYDFPYTPPGYRQDQLVREMIDYAWNKYSLVYEKIKYFEMNPSKIAEKLQSIKHQLHVHQPISLTVLFFVGTFETDPFIKKNGDRFILCYPVEMEWDELRFTQELTRVVYCCKSGLAPSETRTLAQLIFQDGIGLHTARKLENFTPLKAASHYFGKDACTREPNRIMINIIPHLGRTDYEALYSFTKGTGASGFEKEATYTGWNLVGYLLNQRYTFDELTSIPSGRIDTFVEQSLLDLLDHSYLSHPQEYPN